MGNQIKRTWQLPELTTKAKIGIGLVVFVFVGAIATFVVTSIIVSMAGSQDGTSQSDFAAKDTTGRNKDAQKSAAAAITSGNDEKAAGIYERAIAAEVDPMQKVELAIDHSRMLMYESNIEEAVEVAKKAEGYSDDKYLISDWMARLYSNAKRYSDAAMYYERAGGLVESPTNKGGYTKDYYQKKVVAMKALAEKK